MIILPWCNMGLIQLQITSLLSLTMVASKEPQAAYAAGHAKMNALFFIMIFQAVMLNRFLSNCACKLL